MRTTPSRLRFGAVALALLLTARSALAARVTLFQTRSGNDVELDQRLEAELRSDGFEVVVLDVADEHNPARLEQLAARGGSFAAIRQEGSPDGVALEVWIAPARDAPGEWKRLEGSAHASPEALALRAAELLRAHLIEIGGVPESAPNSRAGSESARKHVPPAAEAPRAHVGVGPALVASPGGFGASLAPALGAGYRITDVWSLELRFTGPTAADVSSSAGSAEITESLLVVGARAELLRLGALGGFVAGSAGGYHVGSDGSATPPNQSRADSALTSAWLAGAGLSLEAPVTRDFRVATVVRGDVGLLAPRPVVKLAGDAVARPGRPLVLGTLHFEARW